jgi:hypothetical protein
MPTEPSPRHLQRFVKVEFTPGCGCEGNLVALIVDFCRKVVDNSEVIFAVQMAAFELTENIVKYSSGDLASLAISVDATAEGADLVLTTSNEATRDRLKDADERLTAIELAHDPVAHFDGLVRDTLDSPHESRLGIGRLRAEAALTLSHSLKENWITVTVRHRIGTGSGIS